MTEVRTREEERDGFSTAGEKPKPFEFDAPNRLVPLAAAAVFVLIGAVAAWGMTDGRKAAPADVEAGRPPLAPPPMLLRPLSKEAALDLNRKIPFSPEFNPAAEPFKFNGDDEARLRALECLTAAIYYEAASEGREGQQAVAQIVLNRVRHPAFPASVCKVVYEGSTRGTGCQFTFTCDGSLVRAPVRRLWTEARRVAWEALSGAVYAPVGLSTHYHAEYVVPYWATSLAKSAQVGLHIFYRWPGAWGRAAAFSQRHSREADPRDLRASALMAKGIWPYQASARRVISQVVADPNVELAGVISLVASAPAARESEYETAVRAFFAGGSAHLAVRILQDVRARSAAGVPVSAPGTIPAAWREPAVLSAAARDFARQSDFARFVRDHHGTYREAAGQAGGAAAVAAALWESYTRLPVQARSITLALAPVDGVSLCLAKHLGAGDGRLVRWSPSTDATAADIFIASGLTDGILSSKKRPVASGVEEQIVRAAFVRIETLRRGERAGALELRRQVDSGYALVPLFAERLVQYERNLAEYPTLRDFVPVLLAGVGSIKSPGGKPAIEVRQASC